MRRLFITCLALGSILSAPAAALAVSGSSAIMASAESEPTDITASDPFHDLTLIYLDGDMSKFTGPSDFLRKDRPNDYFQVCGYRPWNEDLYIYLYFNNASKVFSGFKESYDYVGLFTIYEKGEGNTIASKTTKTYDLHEVGTRWKSGAQSSGGPYYFVKMKVEGIFEGAGEGSAYDVCFRELGIMAGQNGDVFSKLYDVEEEYSFNYDRDNYDITAKWWANNAVRMDPIKGLVRMTKQHEGWYYDLMTMRNYVPTSGYFEDFYVFFDLDRTPSQILSVDFYWSEVTFYGSAVKMYRSTNMDIMNGKGFGDFNVPEEFSYSPGNEIELKYAGTEWSTQVKQKFRTVKADQTVVHSQKVTSYLPPFTTVRQVESPEIVNLKALPAQMQDADQRAWLTEQGSGFHYACLINGSEELICDWTDKLDRADTYWAPDFPALWNQRTDYYYLYKAHAFDNAYALKMVVKDEKGQEASWNVFNHAVEGYDHVTMHTHDVTFEEWAIHIGKMAGDWLVPVILTAYSVLAAASVILLTSAIMKAGRKKD